MELCQSEKLLSDYECGGFDIKYHGMRWNYDFCRPLYERQ